MTTGYPFRLYANPLKIGSLLLASLALAIFGCLTVYNMAFGPGAHPSMQDTLKAVALLILFGLAGLVFVWGFVFLIIARRPLLQITAQGWRYRTGFLLLKVVSLGWSEIAHIGSYCHVGPQTTTSYLAVLPRSEAVRAALDKGTPPSSLPAMFSSDVRKISLSYVFLRVTPQACERLLQNLQTTCASEIARNGVYLEPKVL